MTRQWATRDSNPPSEGVQQDQGAVGEREDEQAEVHGERDLVQPFCRFGGHRNCRTILKECAFWDERKHVASGSDDGRVFIWNRYTGHVVRCFVADGHVVNCVCPKKRSFEMICSGIDHDVKIYPDSRRRCA